MPDNELADMLRGIIQEELKPINERLNSVEKGQQGLNTRFVTLEAGQQELNQSQDRLVNRVNRLEIRMENEVIDKVCALFDSYNLRGDQIENIQKHFDERIDCIEKDTGYLVSRGSRLEKMVK